MKKKIALFLFVGMLAIGVGLMALVSPAQAKPECTYTCDYATGIATVCCWEWIPKNPNCKGKNCPGEYDWVCWTEPCGPF